MKKPDIQPNPTFLAEHSERDRRHWALALCDPKYKPGVGYLYSRGKFCCLGVAEMASGNNLLNIDGVGSPERPLNPILNVDDNPVIGLKRIVRDDYSVTLHAYAAEFINDVAFKGLKNKFKHIALLIWPEGEKEIKATWKKLREKK